MEPITWSWVFLAVLGGIVGNRADWAVSKAFGTGLKAFANHLKQGNQYVNQDLEKAIYRCFLLALQSAASECLEQLTGGMKYRGVYQCLPEHQSDVQWLDQRLKQLAKELEQVERSKQVQISLESITEIEMLLLPSGELNQSLALDVRQRLVDLALKDPSVPASYREKVENSLFERICAYFAFEIKHNQVVRDIFQSQLLVQINQNLQEQQLTLEDIEHILCGVARAVPKVLVKLEALEKAFGRLDYNLNLGFGSVLVQLSNLDQGILQIIEIATVTAESVAEIQVKLERLLQNQQQLQPRNEFWVLTGDKTIKLVNASARIFISHRAKDPDFSLAKQFYEGLKEAGHQPFLSGENIELGQDWGKRVDEELEKCDYFLLLLSEQSANREMIIEEVRTAKSLHDENQKPVIIPIRVNFSRSSQMCYAMRAWLNPLQDIQWKSPDDTPRILEAICSLLANGLVPATDVSVEALPTIPPAIEYFDSPPVPMAEPELPQGQLQQASTFYIERPPVESRCYQAIVQPGALVRIKAPQQMGKTSLMSRILNRAREQGYRTVSLSFQLAASTVFTDLDKLLQWFCASVSQKLGLPNKLAEHWQDGLDPIHNSEVYFEDYLLPDLNSPLVLALDSVDRVFEHHKIANDFCRLLRGWNDLAASTEVWQKLRLIVVHSTEVYSSLDINSSPLAGVGETIGLQDFSPPQVQDLAQRYRLNWQAAEVDRLMTMVGGHPYLVRVALAQISRQEVTLDQLLQEAPTEAGIYSDHLRRHLWNLQRYPELTKALKEVTTATTPVRLESESTFKLQSMGLIALQGNDGLPRCNLYRQYFHERLKDS
jgi:hypothetical protein